MAYSHFLYFRLLATSFFCRCTYMLFILSISFKNLISIDHKYEFSLSQPSQFQLFLCLQSNLINPSTNSKNFTQKTTKNKNKKHKSLHKFSPKKRCSKNKISSWEVFDVVCKDGILVVFREENIFSIGFHCHHKWQKYSI